MASPNLEVPYGGPDANSILSQSHSLWQAALRLAESTPAIPHSSLNLERVLFRTPALPERISCDAAWIEGYSLWRSLDTSCRGGKAEKPRKLPLRKLHPTTCTLSLSRNFLDWDGNPNNGITLLILGWAYILSASLAERQGLDMEYGQLLDSSGSTETNPVLKLDLDYAQPHELAWWKAIASRGVGWSMAGGQVSPWAVRVDDIGLEIAGKADITQHPPTAREAACYLARLCHAYGLGSQRIAAIAAALTIPLHASTAMMKSVTIDLPKPSFSVRVAPPGQKRCPTEFKRLSYYMSLSICPWIFGPSLWSIFWEPGVPCNFAGAWLGPITEILNPIIEDNNLELLARVLSFTNVAPLWLGVALCGRQAVVEAIIPSLAQLRDYPYGRPDVDSAVWTGVPQSFMDISPPGPYLRNGMVSRADVWRLRHHFNHMYEDTAFRYTPAYGWPPFGEMRAEDVELEIRRHLQCSHQWEYAWWTWLPDKSADPGFLADPKFLADPPAPPPLRQLVADGNELENSRALESKNIPEASKIATKAVFWWCCSEVEKGFGGTLVEHRTGPDRVLESTDSHTSLDPEVIQRWLQTIT